jgi:transglutaminase-like putative cysteine protease
MWDFDGRTWSVRSFVHTTPRIEAQGAPVNYEVTLEPHNRRWLFALDLPARAPPRSLVSSDYQLYSVQPVNNRLRYDLTSLLNARFGDEESQFALNRALQLPSRFNPRAQELGRSLRQKHADEEGIIGEMLSMFRRNFVYTLEPPLLGEHPVDEFLFSTRTGFCEHYASSFAVVMRAAGIPTRIVTGYQGGEVNVYGDYLIVRQADAHAWTEVWLRGRGWVRVDPTFAVAPVRVDTGISAAVPRTDPLPLMVRAPFEFVRQVRLTWDYMANTWNQWVLGYTPERQRSLLAAAGVDNVTWEKLTAILFVLAGIIVAMFTALALRQLKLRVRDPVRTAYLRYCDKLRRKGLARAPDEGPVDYARRVERQRPDLASAVEAITRLYVALRYGAESSATALLELQRRVRQFTA